MQPHVSQSQGSIRPAAAEHWKVNSCGWRNQVASQLGLPDRLAGCTAVTVNLIAVADMLQTIVHD